MYSRRRHENMSVGFSEREIHLSTKFGLLKEESDSIVLA